MNNNNVLIIYNKLKTELSYNITLIKPFKINEQSKDPISKLLNNIKDIL